MKYTNTAISFAIAFAVAFMAISNPSFALTVSDSGTTAGTVATPGTADAGTTAGTISTPGTADAGTTAGTIPTPATADAGTTAGSVSTETPATPGTSVSSGGGSSYSSGGGSSLPVLVNTGDCKYISTYMGVAKNTTSSDVTKLQYFLKSTEGMNVNVTGIFDSQTLAAVNAFQAKYAADILAPWGVSTPTGQVYSTTMKKINELFCKKNFSLTASQISEIEAYRTRIQNGTSVTGGSEMVGTPTGSINSGSDNSTTTLGESQVGAVAKTSVFTKIWNFTKWIFGR